MTWIEIAMAILSGLCLISLISFIWMFFSNVATNRKKPCNLHNVLYGSRIRGRFAAFGLFICLYQGIEALLFWVPNDWTYSGEDGPLPYKLQIAGLLAGFSALLIIASLERLSSLLSKQHGEETEDA